MVTFLWYAPRQQSSDFDRGRRQQEVLLALSPGLQTGVARIPEYCTPQDAVEKDLWLGDLITPLRAQN